MRYSVSILNIEGNKWETIAVFTSKANLDAVIDYCIFQFETGNSINVPASDIKISDTNSGEVYWRYSTAFEEDNNESDNTDNAFDLVGYDPFKGYYEREGAVKP